MPNENTSLKPSFFKEYFRYKLRGLKGFTITFAVMNFLILTVFAAIILIMGIIVNQDADDKATMITYNTTIIFSMIVTALALVFIAEIILIIVMAALNLKFYHNRSAMDTIGGLPLTVKQRFWGDTLSGATSFMISFIPCSVSALIMMAVVQFGIMSEVEKRRIENGNEIYYMFPNFKDNVLIIGALVILTLFICLAAAYAVTCFVTSCCGRIETSIIFSFVVLGAMPIIVGAYGSFIFYNAVGIGTSNLDKAVGTLPPVGTLFYLMYSLYDKMFEGYEFTVWSPKVIIMLAFIVLPMLGSYVIANRRKAERVDNPFICKIAYSAVSLLITAAALGLVLINFDVAAFVVPVVIFTIAACLYIEYIRSHSKRTFWRGLVRFAGSAAVCAVFGLITYKTNGFNIDKKLPVETNIESVTVYNLDTGNFRPSDSFDDESVISAVLSEHKKVTGNIDKFYANRNIIIYGGSKTLEFKYTMKDGTESKWIYVPKDKDGENLIGDFKNTIKNMPEVYNESTLGILGDPDMPCVNVELSFVDPETSLVDYYLDIPSECVIKPELLDEFKQCLYNDIKNYNREAIDHPEQIAGIQYTYIDKAGNRKNIALKLDKKYKEVYEFLSDPNNFSTEISVKVDNDTVYMVHYYTITDSSDPFPNPYNSTLSCIVTADSDAARELISYFETEFTTYDDYSEKFNVYVNGKDSLRIKKENEHDALKALINVIREQQTTLRGDLS